MRALRTLAAAASALAILSACSGNDASDQTATTNEAAPVDNRSAMANDPNNPYGQTEMQMHERMMAAVGANASETWVRKMIEHHRGAIEMSNVLIAQGGDAPVLAKARTSARKQQKEIGELEAMLAGGGVAAASPEPQGPATAPAAKARSEPGNDAAPVPKAKAEASQAAPKPAPKAEPETTPEPQAKAATKAPVAAPACAPEHRAAGHC